MHESVSPLLLRLLAHVPLVLVMLASARGLSRYTQYPPTLRALTLLACFDALMELLNYVLLWLNLPNLFLMPLVLVGELGLLLLVYGRALQSNTFWRLAPWGFGLLVAYAPLGSVLAPGTIEYWPSLRVVANLVPLLLAGLYFRQLLNELRVARLSADPLFWLSIGLVLYTLGDLLIGLFSNYLFSTFSHELNRAVWFIHTFLNIVLYFCYCVALWLRPAQLAKPAA